MLERSDVGIKLNKYGPNIPYLVFADDCIIFCRAPKTVARNVKHNLDRHCKGFWTIFINCQVSYLLS